MGPQTVPHPHQFSETKQNMYHFFYSTARYLKMIYTYILSLVKYAITFMSMTTASLRLLFLSPVQYLFLD